MCGGGGGGAAAPAVPVMSLLFAHIAAATGALHTQPPTIARASTTTRAVGARSVSTVHARTQTLALQGRSKPTINLLTYAAGKKTVGRAGTKIDSRCFGPTNNTAVHAFHHLAETPPPPDRRSVGRVEIWETARTKPGTTTNGCHHHHHHHHRHKQQQYHQHHHRHKQQHQQLRLRRNKQKSQIRLRLLHTCTTRY